MTKNILSFLVKMVMVALFVLSFYQLVGLLNGDITFIFCAIILLLNITLLRFLNKLDTYITQNKVHVRAHVPHTRLKAVHKLSASKNSTPLRSA